MIKIITAGTSGTGPKFVCLILQLLLMRDIISNAGVELSRIVVDLVRADDTEVKTNGVI